MTKNEQNIEVFKTTDLPLATYLKCKGVALADDYNPHTKEWTFGNYEVCRSHALELTNGSAKVNVLEYEMHRKNLLSLAKRSR